MNRPLALIPLVALMACSSKGAAVTPVDAAAPKDTPAVDTPAAPDVAPVVDVPATPDVPAASDVPSADGNANTADVPPGEYYLPPGTTLTPFLSTDRVATFTAANTVLVEGRDYLAVIETDAGRMVLDLTETQTPITVNSFVFLARNHFFDGIAFHRVITGFVVQGGDPNTLTETRTRWGTGGPGYNFGTEIVPELRFNDRGVLGMARSTSRNSNGSQFYITLAPTPSLNDQYTVFGRVVDGLDVLSAIAVGEPPAVPTRMSRVYIVER